MGLAFKTHPHLAALRANRVSRRTACAVVGDQGVTEIVV
jgi:hypothetical protein